MHIKQAFYNMLLQQIIANMLPIKDSKPASKYTVFPQSTTKCWQKNHIMLAQYSKQWQKLHLVLFSVSFSLRAGN